MGLPEARRREGKRAVEASAHNPHLRVAEGERLGFGLELHNLLRDLLWTRVVCRLRGAGGGRRDERRQAGDIRSFRGRICGENGVAGAPRTHARRRVRKVVFAVGQKVCAQLPRGGTKQAKIFPESVAACLRKGLGRADRERLITPGEWRWEG